MALFDSGVPLANVALSDTFNTWRVRTNQINTQAAGLASNNTFTGTLNTFNNTASFKGPVTAPIITANTVNGTAANFTTLQADSIDFDGDLTVDKITANTGAFNGPVTAPSITANTFTGDGSGLTGLSAGLDWSTTTSTATHYLFVASNTSGSGIDQFNVPTGVTVHPGSARVTANTFAGTLVTAAQPNVTSVGTLTSLALSGNTTFGDNNRLLLGTGSDLQIWHDGAESYVLDNGTGNLNIRSNGSGIIMADSGSNVMGRFLNGNAVDLYFNSNVKFATTIFGVDVTGKLVATGDVSANSFIGDGSGLTGISAGATVTDKSDNVDYNIVFTNETSGSQSLAGIDNGSLIYNPSTGQLSATDFNSTSDVAYKEEVQPITNATEIVSLLSGKSFNWKHTGKKSYGVIAQELEQVLPDVVHENANGKSVNYNTLIAFLIESNKELLNRIEVLESKLEN